MRKRFLILALALMWVLVGVSGKAEQELNNQKVMAEACEKLTVWENTFRTWNAAYTEDDDKTMFQLGQNVLTVSQSVILEAMSGEERNISIQNDLFYRENQCHSSEQNTYCQTSVIWMEELQCFATCDMVYRDQYVSVKYSLYDNNGIFIGTQRLEVGQRNNEAIMLVVDYDNTINATGRFAMKIDGTSSDIIFTKTLGMNLDIVLDINGWQYGENIAEWNKKLLLPMS